MTYTLLSPPRIHIVPVPCTAVEGVAEILGRVIYYILEHAADRLRVRVFVVVCARSLSASLRWSILCAVGLAFGHCDFVCA